MVRLCQISPEKSSHPLRSLLFSDLSLSPLLIKGEGDFYLLSNRGLKFSLQEGGFKGGKEMNRSNPYKKCFLIVFCFSFIFPKLL